MRSDEQILYETRDFLQKIEENLTKNHKKPEKVLREVTEDEIRVLEDVLDDLDPANLPLNDLFSNKMRVVIPFPTIDTNSELGKFSEFFRSQEYDVDWEKGMVYAERDLRTSDDFLDTLMGGPQPKKKIKKIQMKIGKLFSKLADLSRRKTHCTKKSMITYLINISGQMAKKLTHHEELPEKC